MLLALLGMANPASAQTSEKTWYVQPPTSVEVASAAAVLQRRFDDLRSGFFTSVSTRVNANAVTLTFKGWAPSPGHADFLARTTGQFAISKMGPASRPFVTTVDVADAREMPDNTVAIRLTDEGTLRMTQNTRTLVGAGLAVDMDGKPLARPRLNEPLGARFSLGMPNGPDAKLVSIVLRSGPLPTGVMVFNSNGLPTAPPRAKQGD